MQMIMHTHTHTPVLKTKIFQMCNI